jgi:hypothetical protein
MLPALLEESGTTSRFLRMRDRLGVLLALALCAVGLAACGGGERQDENEPEGEFPVEISAAEFPAKQSLAEQTDLLLSVENTGDETLPNLAVTIFTVGTEETVGEVDAEEADPSAETDGETGTVSDEDLAEEVEEQLQEELEQAVEDADEDGDESATETTLDEDAEERSVAKGPFSVISQQPGLAIPSRPVWILEQGFPRLAGTEPGPGPPGEIAAASGALAAQTNTFAFGSLEPGESIELVWRVTPVQRGTYTVHYRVAAGLHGNAVAVTGDDSVPEGEFVVQITDAPPQTRVNDAGEVVPIKPGDVIGQSGSSAQQSEVDGADTETSP